MPRMGDILAKLAQNQPLAIGEVEQLRRTGNLVEAAASRLDTLASPTGGLDPDIFHKNEKFSFLPHPCASMYRSKGTTSGALVVANDTWTDVTFDPETATTATWNRSLRIDPANGLIYVTGIDRDTTTLVAIHAMFAANAVGIRGVGWLSDTGDARYMTVNAASTDETYVFNTFVRRIKSAHTTYRMQVYQNSGAPLDCNEMLFTTTVLR